MNVTGDGPGTYQQSGLTLSRDGPLLSFAAYTDPVNGRYQLNIAC